MTYLSGVGVSSVFTAASSIFTTITESDTAKIQAASDQDINRLREQTASILSSMQQSKPENQNKNLLIASGIAAALLLVGSL